MGSPAIPRLIRPEAKLNDPLSPIPYPRPEAADTEVSPPSPPTPKGPTPQSNAAGSRTRATLRQASEGLTYPPAAPIMEYFAELSTHKGTSKDIFRATAQTEASPRLEPLWRPDPAIGYYRTAMPMTWSRIHPSKLVAPAMSSRYSHVRVELVDQVPPALEEPVHHQGMPHARNHLVDRDLVVLAVCPHLRGPRRQIMPCTSEHDTGVAHSSASTSSYWLRTVKSAVGIGSHEFVVG